MSALIKSSIARKYAMALSGLFLVFFLLQHFTINLTSVFSETAFNVLSLGFHGEQPTVVQFALQPSLDLWCCVSLRHGLCFRPQKSPSRDVSSKYASFNGAANCVHGCRGT